ncbi:hypothetical protein JYU34_000791 [Plutella xylostella]|uniref:Uncharacterized protein n=1 Tax=Plutella xylostella TaxID=51655 RepID=A0ABQ7R8K9_PLUXY|nr:hypothetical protein JYU34_000791 [Plutella xylostella]
MAAERAPATDGTGAGPLSHVAKYKLRHEEASHSNATSPNVRERLNANSVDLCVLWCVAQAARMRGAWRGVRRGGGAAGGAGGAGGAASGQRLTPPRRRHLLLIAALPLGTLDCKDQDGTCRRSRRRQTRGCLVASRAPAGSLQ